MTAIVKVASGDAQVYVAAVGNAGHTGYLEGGSIVEANQTVDATTGLPTVRPSGNTSVTVLGVALKDAATAPFTGNPATDGYGYPVLDVGIPDRTLTVESHGIFPVIYTAVAVAFGVKLCAAADGKVRAWVSGTDSPGAVIGYCAEPAGVPGAGGKYLARINV